MSPIGPTGPIIFLKKIPNFMKTLEELKSAIPDFVKDVRMNLQTLLSQENQVLSAKQTFGAALASAYATKQKTLIQILENEAKNFLSEAEINAAKTAAILMAMNNVYYRFLHLTEDKEYAQMPAGLRMKGIADHGIEKNDFEIFALAVSAINGCGMCMDAHAAQLVKHGMSKAQVQQTIKIAAVVNSAAAVLEVI
jgi:alkyl hydroperoxide reductase subunit D